MANIRENKRNGKTVSYRFTACMERKHTIWTLPQGLTSGKERKAAEWTGP